MRSVGMCLLIFASISFGSESLENRVGVLEEEVKALRFTFKPTHILKQDFAVPLGVGSSCEQLKVAGVPIDTGVSVLVHKLKVPVLDCTQHVMKFSWEKTRYHTVVVEIPATWKSRREMTEFDIRWPDRAKFLKTHYLEPARTAVIVVREGELIPLEQ